MEESPFKEKKTPHGVKGRPKEERGPHVEGTFFYFPWKGASTLVTPPPPLWAHMQKHVLHSTKVYMYSTLKKALCHRVDICGEFRLEFDGWLYVLS